MPAVSVRPAAVADLERVVAWWRAMIGLHVERDPHRFRLIPRADASFREYVRGQLDNPDALVLVAEVDGIPAGFSNAVLRLPPPVFVPAFAGCVDNVFVAPERRRHGVGAALLERTRAWLASRGVAEWSANVYVWNEASLALFAKSGLLPRSVSVGGAVAGRWSLAE